MTPTLRNKVANALSFAHLAGLGQRIHAEGDDPDKNDDDKAKGSRAEDDADPKDQDREDGDSKKSKRAEDDDKQRDGESDDDYAKRMEEQDEEKDKAKGSKAKSDDDSDADADDDEEEMRGRSAAAGARRRERARCAAIFGSKAAGRNPVLAANLAFGTSMTRKEALAVLENTPATASIGNDRASRNPGLGAGGSSQPNSRQAVASRWDTAFSKASPRRK